MNNKTKADIIAASAGIGFALLINGTSFATFYLLGYQPTNFIPRDIKIETGFVEPSKLEIKLRDIDKNGRNETLIEYDGKSYLLKLDEQGNPKVQAYEIVTKE